MSIIGGGSGILGGGSGILGGGSGILGGGSGILGGGSGGGSGLGTVDFAFASGALITSRDGIVGDWADPIGESPSSLPQGDPEVLRRWSPWVRAIVFDQVLLQPLTFVTVKEDRPEPDPLREGTAMLWHRPPIVNADGGTRDEDKPKRIFTMSRPKEDKFRAQLTHVVDWADLRVDRAAEILAQIPEILTFFGSVVWLRADRMRWTLELLSAIYRATLTVEMQFKAAMACRRPTEYSALIQPMIETPGHSTYPSGHATESHCFAFVLACLVSHRAQKAKGPSADRVIDQLERLAARITINRTVAGVHFPVDNAAGAALGMTLGRYFVTRAKFGGARPLPEGNFDGQAWFADKDGNSTNPDWETVDGWPHAPEDQAIRESEKNPDAWAADAPLRWLWEQAEGEWT